MKNFLLFISLTATIYCSAQYVDIEGTKTLYTGSLEQLKTHESPEWYNDAKLGIFVHWGLYSVPAFAPTELSVETLFEEMGKENPDPKKLQTAAQKWFTNNAYAEWYLNSLRIKGSPTYEHHKKMYGLDHDYYKFSEDLNKESLKWDSDKMAEIFKKAGAKYVVLTTKHHDGYTLWPSRVYNNNMPETSKPLERDLVGELTASVRKKGMNMGLYYSGGLDWTFNRTPIYDFAGLANTIPKSYEYGGVADAHLRELIEKYQPAILWNDITYPEEGNLTGIIADYYNLVPNGVINNRWGAKTDLMDFETPEYSKMDSIQKMKWETCRGLGNSFGYNQYEDATTTLSSKELIHFFVDIVSKNGNLLLNVGPKPDGTIPEIQLSRLKDLGNWIQINGDAIYGTKPWEKSDTKTVSGMEVRFTKKGDKFYIIILGAPSRKEMIEELRLKKGQKIRMLGSEGYLDWRQVETSVLISLPKVSTEVPAIVLEVSN